MANQNDGSNQSRFIKRRMDLQDADIIMNEMLNKKQKPSSVPTASTPTIGHQHETSSIQHELVTEQSTVITQYFKQFDYKN